MDARKFHKNYENENKIRLLRDTLTSVLSHNKRLEVELDIAESDLEDIKDDNERLEQENAEYEYDRDEYYENWQRCEYALEEAGEMIGNYDIQVMDLEDEKSEYYDNWQLADEALEEAKKTIKDLQEKLNEALK